MQRDNQYIVAFVDILGFSKSIRDYDSGENPELLNQIKEAVNSAGELLTKIYVKPSNVVPNWKELFKIQFFSDCLCAAVPVNYFTYDFMDNFVNLSLYISTYQNILMEKGFFCRGGISIGSYYSDDFIIFSGAMLDAVEIEKSIAVYPRIVLAEKLVDKLNESVSDIKEVLKNLLVIDEEKKVFLNNFNLSLATNFLITHSLQRLSNENLEAFNKISGFKNNIDKFETIEDELFSKSIKKQIRKNLIRYKTQEEVFQKYLWIKEFYDWKYKKSKLFREYSYNG